MLKKVLINKNLKFCNYFLKFTFSNTNKNDNNASYVKANDIKGFGKKFTDDEVKTYLDPFGFLGPNECMFIFNKYLFLINLFKLF